MFKCFLSQNKKKIIKKINNNKWSNNKKEIYNDKYKHTRDRLFGLVSICTKYNIFFTFVCDLKKESYAF